MNKKQAVLDFCLRMGDSCLILAHRNSQWCGHAPAPEEDIAMANVALDLLGQARLWLEMAAEAEGKKRNPDQLAYLRDAPAFRNYALVEQPNADYAHTLIRQFLFDSWHVPTLKALEESREKRIVEIALKAGKEAEYHLERSGDLIERLADGSEESNQRIREALETLWPFAHEFFSENEADRILTEAGIIPVAESIRKEWEETISSSLAAGGLDLPQAKASAAGAEGKNGKHTEHLGYVLAEMQFMQRAYPGAQW